MNKTRFADMVTGILIMLLAVYWFSQANKMLKVELGLGPGGYPMFVSVCLFFFGLLLTLQSVIKGLPKPEGKIDFKAVQRVVIFIAVTFVYVRAMRYLGFLLLTPPYLVFACWFFHYRKKLVVILTSIGTTAVIYIVFRVLFYIPLPVFRLF